MDLRGNITLNLLTTVSAMIFAVHDLITMPAALAIIALATINQYCVPHKAKRIPIRVQNSNPPNDV